MPDMIYLSIGDTYVPFAEHEGDTRAYCRGVQDAFRYLGIDSDVSEAIVETLETKPMLVQKVFLLRVAGLKQKDVAEILHIDQGSVSKCISRKCSDVRSLLRKYVKPQPYDEWSDVDVPASMHN